MAKEPLTIILNPDSELAPTLAETYTPVVLESKAARYTVEREDVFAHYGAEAVLRGLRQSRGALSGVDIEALLADLAEQRSQEPRRCSD